MNNDRTLKENERLDNSSVFLRGKMPCNPNTLKTESRRIRRLGLALVA